MVYHRRLQKNSDQLLFHYNFHTKGSLSKKKRHFLHFMWILCSPGTQILVANLTAYLEIGFDAHYAPPASGLAVWQYVNLARWSASSNFFFVRKILKSLQWTSADAWFCASLSCWYSGVLSDVVGHSNDVLGICSEPSLHGLLNNEIYAALKQQIENLSNKQ